MEGIGGDDLDGVNSNSNNNYGFYFTVNYNEINGNESDETIIDLYPTNGCVDNDGSDCGGVNEIECNNNYEEDKNNVCDINNDSEDIQQRKKKKRKQITKIEIIAKPNNVHTTLNNHKHLKLKQNVYSISITKSNTNNKLHLSEHLLINNTNSSSSKEIKKTNSPHKHHKRLKLKLKPITTHHTKDRETYEEHLIRIRKQFAEQRYLIPEAKLYQYVILPGNASYLVKRCFKHRVNWKESETQITSLFNFKWQQMNHRNEFLNINQIESISQMINHFEFNMNIANKSNLFVNLFSHCENNNINIFQYVPFTILISHNNNNESQFKDIFSNINNYTTNYNSISHLNIPITNNNINNNKDYSNTPYSQLFSLPHSQPPPHKPKSETPSELGSKTNLVIPHTHNSGKNLWLIKASNLNRGQCIRVINSIEQAHSIIKTFQSGIALQGDNKDKEENNIQLTSMNSSSHNIPPNCLFKTDRIIIQKYIEKPLLYKGRKCDMRIWVLLTHELKVYVFKEGHLKTCSASYDIDNNKDAFVHITNYSYQKHCADFQKFEKGNEVSFHDFQKELNVTHADKKINVYKDVMEKVKEIVKLSMMSVKDKINANNRKYCFEIFGYDFMLDEELNMFLIEINANPGIEESSPWIKVIVPRMLDDALRLTVDKVFNTKYEFIEDVKKLTIEECSNAIIKENNNVEQVNENTNNDNKETEIEKDKKKMCNYNSPFPVPGYEQDDNLWELVCDLQNEMKTKSYTGVKHLLNKKHNVNPPN